MGIDDGRRGIGTRYPEDGTRGEPCARSGERHRCANCPTFVLTNRAVGLRVSRLNGWHVGCDGLAMSFSFLGRSPCGSRAPESFAAPPRARETQARVVTVAVERRAQTRFARILLIGSGVLTFASAVACGGAIEPSPDPESGEPSTGSSAPSSPRAAWKNGCRPAAPIRYTIANTDPLKDDTYSACETLPERCKPAEAIDEPRDLSAERTCACVSSVKTTRNNTGSTMCPGNGPVYCDVLSDGSLSFRCPSP